MFQENYFQRGQTPLALTLAWEGRILFLFGIQIWWVELKLRKWKKVYAKEEDGRRERQNPKILYLWDTAMHCILGLCVMWAKSSIYFSHSVMRLSTTHTRYNPKTSTSLENWECSLCTHSINKAPYIRIWGELRAPDALCCLPFCSHWNVFLKSLNRYGVLCGALAIIPSTSTPISLSSLYRYHDRSFQWKLVIFSYCSHNTQGHIHGHTCAEQNTGPYIFQDGAEEALTWRKSCSSFEHRHLVFPRDFQNP